ncbi:Mitogen-activated protein [Hortaea werneckii]|nr:Mitogen-activated protein [Hortaea werneckii]
MKGWVTLQWTDSKYLAVLALQRCALALGNGVPEPQMSTQVSVPSRSPQYLNFIGLLSGPSRSTGEANATASHLHEMDQYPPPTLSGTRHDDLLDRYDILRKIGEGAYGVVYKATPKNSEDEVAIKIIKHLDDKLVRSRTLREIKILHHLRHDNITALVDTIRPYDLTRFSEACFVQEFVPHNLSQIIAAQSLSEHHISYLTHQIFCGLNAIHTAHIIHQDLKPDNILVKENWDLKICDFGLARAEKATEKRFCHMTQYVATRWYRAPEIMLSTYGKAVDVWSVGCILAEMLGRVVLFPGKHYHDQLGLILETLGYPSKQDLADTCSWRASQYIETTFSGRIAKTGTPWTDRFPRALTNVLHLLDGLLSFNPKKRTTVGEALEHPFCKNSGFDEPGRSSSESLTKQACSRVDLLSSEGAGSKR